MTIKHKIKIIPARIKWFLLDIKGTIFYYRKYKSLNTFVDKLKKAYLLEEKKINSAEFLSKKIEYEIAKKILKGKI